MYSFPRRCAIANSLYGKGREHILKGDIAALSDNLKVNLVTTAYTPSINADEFLSDISAGILATSGNLASKSATLGVFNAANVTWSSVTTGSTGSFIGGYKDTGTAGTSDLIFLIDTATGLPVTTNGGDITVQWDTGTNKIFKLFEGLAPAARDWLLDLSRRGLGILIPAILSDSVMHREMLTRGWISAKSIDECFARFLGKPTVIAHPPLILA